MDITGLDVRTLWRFVSSAYRAGYDEIKLVFDADTDYKHLYTAFSYDTLSHLFKDNTPALSPAEAIQALVNRFVGVEIIDQKKNYCIVKELSETTYKEFDNALRRIFLLLLHMAEETMAALKGDKSRLKATHMIDTNLDRFEDFCMRVLNKKGYSDFKKTPTMYSTIFLLELIGDEYKKLAIHLLEHEKKLGTKMEELFNFQKEQLHRFYDLFYNFSKEKTQEIYKMDMDGTELLAKETKSLTAHERELVHHLKKIGVYITSLTELKIDLEV